MKPNNGKLFALFGVMVLVSALPVLLAADRGEIENATVGDDVLASIASCALGDVAMSISADGMLELAGVIGFALDDHGVATVELKRNGDFASDPVLVLRVPIVENGEGKLVAGGILEIAPGPGTVTLTIDHHAADAPRQDVGDTCRTYVPLPPDPPNPYCSGGCSLPSDTCGWVIVDDELARGAEGGERRPLPDLKPALTCDCGQHHTPSGGHRGFWYNETVQGGDTTLASLVPETVVGMLVMAALTEMGILRAEAWRSPAVASTMPALGPTAGASKTGVRRRVGRRKPSGRSSYNGDSLCIWFVDTDALLARPIGLATRWCGGVARG